VSNALGLIVFVVYCLGVVAVAAAITWAVVRFTPGQKPSS
jgi:hypothetical protein